VIEAASFRRTLFLARVPKGTGKFLMRRLASLIYLVYFKKNCQPEAPFGTEEKYLNFGGYDYYRENFYDIIWNKRIEILGFFKIHIK
jgi:hypothetical protein